ncbi:unnamed protein product [Clonostachys rosea]|uniref:Ketoreductase domain-containing protein n=1 Tax=Bionectria ochroleuca TaxID=29856 RepID=A0ABY6UQH3_BIOOC|nr:unnamed protein product [Clonostachys rosea]
MLCPMRGVLQSCGCLGGIGRSLSRWMMSRGARNFVFMGCSGTNKAEARKLVARLEDAGANVRAIRGDVIDPSAVALAVKACEETLLPIGGVIKPPRPNEAWHEGIQPKWQGTWNLHNGLEGHEMDFFLFTSSLSVSHGNATESNYRAANQCLDAFAQWRERQES